MTRSNESSSRASQTPLFVSAPLTAANARFVSASSASAPVFVSNAAANAHAVHNFVNQPLTVARTNQVAHLSHAAVPTVIRTAAAAPVFSHVRAASPVVHAAAHGVVRAAPVVSHGVVRAAPVAYTLADAASRGFLVYDNAGVAYEF